MSSPQFEIDTPTTAEPPAKARKPTQMKWIRCGATPNETHVSEMDFTPSRIEVKRGEQIRFVIRNVGTEDHEFLLSTTEENLKHAELMKKFPHMEHDDPNGVRVGPKKSAE